MNKEQATSLEWSYYGVGFSIFGLGIISGLMIAGIFTELFLLAIFIGFVLYYKSSKLLFKTINGKLEGNNNNKVSGNDTKSTNLNH